MTQASFTQVAVLRSLSTHDALGTGMRTGLPGGEDRPSEGWQAVEWTEVRRPEALGPTRGLGRALQVKLGLEATRSPRAHLPRGSGVPAARPAIDPGASAERKRARRQPRRGRGLAARRRLRSFCSARVCVGSCPRRAAGCDERAFCLRPSGPARLSFLI